MLKSAPEHISQTYLCVCFKNVCLGLLRLRCGKSSGDLFFFPSQLGLLWKDKEKTFYFLAVEVYSHEKVECSFLEVSET